MQTGQPIQRQPFALGALLLSAMVLTGCDTFYGVTRTFEVANPIDPPCVQRALAQTEGIAILHHTLIPQHGMANEHHLFDYRAGHLQGRLSLVARSERSATVTQLYLRNLRAPAQEHVDQMRRHMADIEAQLAASCHVGSASTTVLERCTGVACPPLESLVRNRDATP